MGAKVGCWNSPNAPERCFLCGEHIIYGAMIESAYKSNVLDTLPDRLFLIACYKCTVYFGEITGIAAGLMELGSASDQIILSKLELGYWRGLATSRDEVIRQKCVELHQTQAGDEATILELKDKAERLEKHLDKEAARTKGQGYVYLMRRNNGDYKIGLSGNPDRRLKQIQREFPGVRLLHKIKADDMPQAETMLHGEFMEKRQDGEWFSLTPDDIEKITNLIRFEDDWFLERRNGRVASNG